MLLKLFGLTILVFSLLVVGLALPRASLQAPEPTYLLLDRQHRFVAEISQDVNRGHGFWPIKTWPKRVIEATLAREDRRFWHHPGIDVIAVARALFQNISAGRRISGASTLAMQVARMQSNGERTYFNKAIEAVTALLLTAKYDREEILEHYLRLVPYGNQIYGISYAAERYFSKTVEDLSWAEIALLAAIPQSPTLNNPLRPKGRIRAQHRAEMILRELKKQLLISEAQYQLAITQLQTFDFPAPQPREPGALHSIFKLQQQIEKHKTALDSFRIETTLDLALQMRIQAMTRDFKKHWQNSGATNVAVVVLDTASSEVLVWSGSSDYFDKEAGAIDFIQQPRSSGSTLKPFIYALALDRGDISAATLLADLVSVSHGLSNSDNRFLGPMLPRQALANSRNIPALNLIRKIGIEHSYQFLRELGLHDDTLPARHYGSGLAIGALPVTLEALMQAYGALANDGQLKKLRWFRQQPQIPADYVLTANVARQINLFPSDPQARLPSFPRIGT
ncbi:MAG: glycosyl transferase, partial [Aestuariibacter sp.]|nr:glycosyl transferase [Aestuariibacter sp.]